MEHILFLFIEKFKAGIPFPAVCVCVRVRARATCAKFPVEETPIKASHIVSSAAYFSAGNPHIAQDYWLFSVTDAVKPSLYRNSAFYTHVFVL
jgi:hypothetical protein